MRAQNQQQFSKFSLPPINKKYIGTRILWCGFVLVYKCCRAHMYRFTGVLTEEDRSKKIGHVGRIMYYIAEQNTFMRKVARKNEVKHRKEMQNVSNTCIYPVCTPWSITTLLTKTHSPEKCLGWGHEFITPIPFLATGSTTNQHWKRVVGQKPGKTMRGHKGKHCTAICWAKACLNESIIYAHKSKISWPAVST